MSGDDATEEVIALILIKLHKQVATQHLTGTLNCRFFHNLLMMLQYRSKAKFVWRQLMTEILSTFLPFSSDFGVFFSVLVLCVYTVFKFIASKCTQNKNTKPNES